MVHDAVTSSGLYVIQPPKKGQLSSCGMLLGLVVSDDDCATSAMTVAVHPVTDEGIG
jgi:hypothetical protein